MDHWDNAALARTQQRSEIGVISRLPGRELRVWNLINDQCDWRPLLLVGAEKMAAVMKPCRIVWVWVNFMHLTVGGETWHGTDTVYAAVYK